LAFEALLADSLYANEPVMDLCKTYNWEYHMRFKAGSILAVASEYKWCNGIE